jgi:GNAT superfamily N-acetyltransferase
MQSEILRITDFCDVYADAVSAFILKNLFEVNSKDYTTEELKELSRRFTPEELILRSKQSRTFLALKGQNPIGTLSVSYDTEENAHCFAAVFVHPDHHHRQIGRLLVRQGEAYTAMQGGRIIIVPSSITSHGFYHKMGYQYKEGAPLINDRGQIILRKYLD